MPKTLYQEITGDIIGIIDAAKGLNTRMQTQEFEHRLRRLSSLIESYFGLRGLCDPTPGPLKVGGFFTQPNPADRAMAKRELAQRIMSEVRSPGTDDEKLEKVVGLLLWATA